jgi:uncharacterized membrane protein
VPLLIIGLLLFLLPHLLRQLGLRDRLIETLPSEAAYKGAFSLAAFLGLGLIILGKGQASFSMVWQPFFEWRVLSHVLMLPAFILLAAGNMPSSHLGATVRNPMVLGVVLWGTAHLWANGDLASVLLFGSFTVWGLVKFTSLARNYELPAKPPRIIWDIIAVVVGLILYGLITIFHGQLFGVGLSLA